MYSRLQLASKYISYLFIASNGKGHGTHSPFVFDFIKNVLNDKRDFYAYSKIESIRKKLLADNTVLEVDDFGAGSVIGTTKKRSIQQIALNAAKPKKLGQLLFRVVNYYQPKHIIELGTSLGLSAAYLAEGNLNAQVTTMEGAKAIAKVAQRQFDILQLPNIKLVEGDFGITLQDVLQKMLVVDLVFIDGNHRKAATLDYFRQLLLKKNDTTILVFDDIHWSKEMEAAWKEIKEHPDVRLTIDLFFLGLVFFRKEFKTKQNFIIRF
jgi:predicted O-methyltransferase YrrM